MIVHVLNFHEPKPEGIPWLDTTTRSKTFGRNLSPMLVGPIVANGLNCWNVENAWQFSKVYPEHVGADNEPTPEYFRWRGAGYDNKWASRYPKGKGTKPLYSLWSGEKLDYIAARKKFTSLFIVTR